MTPWREFEARLAELSTEQVEARAEDLVERQSAEYPPVAGAIRRQLEVARAEDDLKLEVVRIALWQNELTAFVSYPFNERAFRIQSYLWGNVALSYHDSFRSIEEGLFAIEYRNHKPNSIERDLANRPLFTEFASVKRWLKIQPASLARQRKVAQAVIDEFRVSNPSERMTRAAFIAAVSRRLAGLSKGPVIRLWREVAPADWKQPGRKS